MQGLIVTALDTETSGTHDNAEIVQLAAIMYGPERNILGQFCVLIKPAGWTISDETQAFHTQNGPTINQSNCNRFGIGIASAIGMLNIFLQRSDVAVGHNLDYDIKRLQYAQDKYKLPLHLPDILRCTKDMATEILQLPPTEKMAKYRPDIKYKSPNLAEAYRFFNGSDFSGAHGALADAEASANIYFHIEDRNKHNV